MKKSAAKTTNVQPISSTPTRKPQTSKEVIAANVQLLIEQLEAGHSEGLTSYLTAMGRFHTYSLGNILEIARQRPDATRVAGLYAWNQLGRRVKKGERGIRILAPVIGSRRKSDTGAEKDVRTENQPVLVGFRSVYVFDVAQTEGKELPEIASKVTGNVGEYRERKWGSILAKVAGGSDPRCDRFTARDGATRGGNPREAGRSHRRLRRKANTGSAVQTDCISVVAQTSEGSEIAAGRVKVRAQTGRSVALR